MAVVVTRCGPSGLTQTADIKGGWLVFRMEDGGKTTTVFIPFDPPIIYLKSRACGSVVKETSSARYNTDCPEAE